MQLSALQEDFIRQHSLVVLSTVTPNNAPWSIIVEVNKVDGDTLIITDNQMETTQDNIKINPKVCIIVTNIKDYSYMKIDGVVRYYESGEYFDYVKNLPWNIWYTPKWVLAVKIENIKEVV